MSSLENHNFEPSFAEAVRIFHEQYDLLSSSVVQGEIIPLLLHHTTHPNLVIGNRGGIGFLIANISGVSREQVETVIQTIEQSTSPDITASAQGIDTTYDLEEYEINKAIVLAGSIIFWYDL